MTRPEQIRYIVWRVPCGKVVTYGAISEKVYGHGRAGPAVGQAIKANEEVDGFPWWRVVNSKWRPIKCGQKKRLVCEGVRSDNGRVRREHRHQLKPCSALDECHCGPRR